MKANKRKVKDRFIETLNAQFRKGELLKPSSAGTPKQYLAKGKDNWIPLRPRIIGGRTKNAGRSGVPGINMSYATSMATLKNILLNTEKMEEGYRQDAVLAKLAAYDLTVNCVDGKNTVKSANATFGVKTIRGRKTYLEGERYVLRQKIQNPTVQHINDALEKFFRKNTFDKDVLTLEEMSSKEKEYEKKMIKHRRFCDFLAMLLSMIYAISLFFMGIGIYVADIYVMVRSHYSLYFNIYLAAVGIAWLIWFDRDIEDYTKEIQVYWTKNRSKLREVHLVKNEQGMVELDLPELKKEKEHVISDFYMFSTERDGGSYFLKVGAAVFCLGHLIHLFLNLIKLLSFYTEDNPECVSLLEIFSTMAHFTYSACMVHMIFKYSNIIINRDRTIAKFALMHCIASCMCFWVYLIVAETFETMEDSALKEGGGMEEEHEETDGQDCEMIATFQHTCYVNRMYSCTVANAMAHRIASVVPFLFPFSIEFNILIVGVWIVMWHNIGKVDHHVESQIKFIPDKLDSEYIRRKRAVEPLITYADCNTSEKGLLIGVVVFGLAVIGLISYFVLTDAEMGSPGLTTKMAFYSADTLQTFVLFLMTMTSIKIYAIVADLDLNPHPVEFLDDLLLFICVPAFFWLAICVIAPSLFYILYLGTNKEAVGQVVVNLVTLVQVCIQTPLIVDGLRRCSEKKITQRKKPGRQYISFLLVANLIVYIWDNMKVKSGTHSDVPSIFYPPFMWLLIHHTCLPLTLFYRFHSAVALADIWTSAYEPGDHEDHYHMEYETVRVLPPEADDVNPLDYVMEQMQTAPQKPATLMARDPRSVLEDAEGNWQMS